MNKESNDVEILKHLWKGEVPFAFQLASNEVTSLETPHPYFEMVKRMSYLGLVTEKIKLHFGQYVSKFDTKGDIWFEAKRSPLKWSLPVGVLFDLLTDVGEHAKSCPPLEIVVHFSGFPSNRIMSLYDEKDIQWHFMNTLKQGTYLRYGDTKTVMMLPTQEQKDLWDSVKGQNFSAYNEVKEKFLEKDQEDRFQPVRFCWLEESEENPFPSIKMKLLCVPHKDCKEKTIADLLGDLKELQKNDKMFSPNFELSDAEQLSVQGVTPTKDTKLEWLLKVGLYPDGFNYFVIKKKKKVEKEK